MPLFLLRDQAIDQLAAPLAERRRDPAGRAVDREPRPVANLRPRVHLGTRHRRGGARDARQIVRDADDRAPTLA